MLLRPSYMGCALWGGVLVCLEGPQLLAIRRGVSWPRLAAQQRYGLGWARHISASLLVSAAHSCRLERNIKWEAPGVGCIKLNTDGAVAVPSGVVRQEEYSWTIMGCGVLVFCRQLGKTDLLQEELWAPFTIQKNYLFL